MERKPAIFEGYQLAILRWAAPELHWMATRPPVEEVAPGIELYEGKVPHVSGDFDPENPETYDRVVKADFQEKPIFMDENTIHHLRRDYGKTQA